MNIHLENCPENTNNSWTKWCAIRLKIQIEELFTLFFDKQLLLKVKKKPSVNHLMPVNLNKS